MKHFFGRFDLIRQMVAATLALVSMTVFADTAVYSGTLGVPNVGYASFQENITGSTVYVGIARAQKQFMNTIKSTISTPIMSIITTIPGYQPGSAYVSVSGPVTFTLNNGIASFSGLRVGASLSASQTQNGLTATCLVQVATNPGMTITGTVDPASGTFTITGIQNFNLSTSYSCSSNLDWLPIVNIIVDTLINQSVDKAIAQQTQNAYNALNNIGALAPIHFVGIDTIPSGKLIYNGVDYAAQLKAGLANLFYSTNMSVTIGDPTYYMTGPKGYAHIAYSTDLVLAFNINGFTFQLLDKRSYVDEVYCPSTTTYCYFF